MGIFMKGATAYEAQIGPFHVRILRYKYWFCPYFCTWRRQWQFPMLVQFKYWKNWRDQ